MTPCSYALFLSHSWDYERDETLYDETIIYGRVGGGIALVELLRVIPLYGFMATKNSPGVVVGTVVLNGWEIVPWLYITCVCRIADLTYGILYNTYMFSFWLRLTCLFFLSFLFSKIFLAFSFLHHGWILWNNPVLYQLKLPLQFFLLYHLLLVFFLFLSKTGCITC